MVSDTIAAFHTLGRYFKLIENQIDLVKNEDRKRIEALLIRQDEETYQTEYQAEIGAHMHEFKKTLPRVTSYSFVIMLYSEFEYRIKELCREIKKRENIQVKIGDFRGDLIRQIKKFLSVANKMPLEETDIKLIRILTIIRNCIVHHNGFLKNYGKADDLIGVSGEQIHISVDKSFSNNRIKVNTSFCYSCTNHFVDLFRRLFKEYGFGPEYPEISS